MSDWACSSVMYRIATLGYKTCCIATLGSYFKRYDVEKLSFTSELKTCDKKTLLCISNGSF